MTCFFLMAIVAGARLARARDAEALFNVTAVEFESGGKKITADHYQPRTARPRARVIVLHGAGGTLFDGPDMRRMSRDVASAGHDVYFVHYFNRTGTWFGLDAGMQRNFPAWLQTVKDAIKWVRGQQPERGPIGLYGYSLGGFLALAAGSDNPDVGAIVEQAGGMWNGNESLIRQMPPVLLVHGSADQRVPLNKYAIPLVALLQRRGIHFDKHFFAGQGHVFSQSASVEVRRDAVKFFERNLAPKEKR